MLLPILAAAALVPALATAVTPTSSAAVATPTSSKDWDSPKINKDTAIFQSFAGLPDDPQKPWGLGAYGRDGAPTLLPINFDPAYIRQVTPLGYPRFHLNFTDSHLQKFIFSPMPNMTAHVTLGGHSIVSNHIALLDFQGIFSETVPADLFTINLGRSGIWNSSIAFNDFYDANRIGKGFTSLTGLRTPYHTDRLGYEFVKANGKLDLGYLNLTQCTTDLCGPGKITTVHVHMDFSADSIKYPSGFSCNQTHRLKLNSYPGNIITDASESVRIFANLTSVPGRCTTGGTDVILGKPFFQAAVVVNQYDELLVAEAHQHDLPMDLKYFPDTRQTLINVKNPEFVYDSAAARGSVAAVWSALVAGTMLSMAVALF